MSDREDDLTLIEFLRQHQGVSPSPAPDLEARIMKSVAICPRLSPQRRYLWLIPSAIAVTSLCTWVGYQLFIPFTAPVQTAEVETFWTENWEIVFPELTSEYMTDSSTTLLAEEWLYYNTSLENGVSSAELTTYQR
jgi:hypothetical protein